MSVPWLCSSSSWLDTALPFWGWNRKLDPAVNSLVWSSSILRRAASSETTLIRGSALVHVCCFGSMPKYRSDKKHGCFFSVLTLSLCLQVINILQSVLVVYEEYLWLRHHQMKNKQMMKEKDTQPSRKMLRVDL